MFSSFNLMTASHFCLIPTVSFGGSNNSFTSSDPTFSLKISHFSALENSTSPDFVVNIASYDSRTSSKVVSFSCMIFVALYFGDLIDLCPSSGEFNSTFTDMTSFASSRPMLSLRELDSSFKLSYWVFNSSILSSYSLTILVIVGVFSSWPGSASRNALSSLSYFLKMFSKDFPSSCIIKGAFKSFPPFSTSSTGFSRSLARSWPILFLRLFNWFSRLLFSICKFSNFPS